MKLSGIAVGTQAAERMQTRDLMTCLQPSMLLLEQIHCLTLGLIRAHYLYCH